jgi:signal transduction histidine kinase
MAALEGGVLIEDERRRLVAVNDSFRQLFWISPPESLDALVGLDCSGLAERAKGLFAHPDGFVARMSELVADREQVLGEEMAMADGRVLECDFVPVEDGGVDRGHLWHFHEVTDRRRAERDREELRVIKGLNDEFIARVSHELRTPLTSVIGFVQLALDADLDGDARGYLEIADENAGRLSRLIEDLLLLTRVDAGQFTMHSEPVELGPLVQEMVESNAAAVEEKGITLFVEIEGSVPALVDIRHLRQVIDKLLANAVKFTPPGGSIRIRAGTVDGWARVEVEDDGIGIAAAEQGGIFGRFVRGDAAREAELQGAGLGLAIVRAIVEASGGTVDLRSAERVGTTVRVQLPLPR